MLATDDDLKRASTMIDVELSDKDKERVMLYIDNAKNMILTLLSVKEFPNELNYIVDDVVLAKFNKFHNEGMNSISEEGLSITFEPDELKKYYPILQVWLDNHNNQATNGKAIGWEW